jgi:hypothetical protein
MAGLAAAIEREILTLELPLLDATLPKGEFVMPHYQGYSIVNIPATNAALLGIELPHSIPIPGSVWEPYADGVRCVVQIVIDALGYRRLQQHMALEPDSLFHRLLGGGGRLIPLTSVCPSTTTTALSSLWSGRLPIEHGMLGTRLFLRERGLQANMIYFSPVGFRHREILVEEGMDPGNFLPVPGIAGILSEQGVASYVFINRQYAAGGLSEIFFRGVKTVHTFVPGSAADLWILLRRFLEEHANERLFVSVYWGVIDSLAHERGPSTSAIDAELRMWTHLMEEQFLSQLSSQAAAGTLLTMLADHGQVDVSPPMAIRLQQNPELLHCLLMKPLGEQRLPYLYARQGQIDCVRDYCRERLGYAFAVLDAELALKAGLFGSGMAMTETSARLGDLVLVARKNHILYDEDADPHLLGLHGGLSADEMLVPYLLVRLDK